MDLVRSIKVTDYLIFASEQEVATMENKCKCLETLKSLGTLLKTRQAQLAEEIAKPEPNMARASRLRAIVGNLQVTLKTAQR